MCELVSVQGSAPFWERFGFERVAEFEYAPGRAGNENEKENFMSILVTGGTGTVGSAVVKELVAKGAGVNVLTRDPAKLKDIKGITAVQGNLLEPATVRRVFNGVESVFLLNPVSQTEGERGADGRHRHARRRRQARCLHLGP